MVRERTETGGGSIDRSPLADRDIRALEGGALVLEARAAAHRLLNAAEERSPGRSGSHEGWSDLARRGRLEHLLLSEHLHDADEFLRRFLDGEQLYLRQRFARTTVAAGVLCWELTAAALGAARRVALGAVLAAREHCLARCADFVLLINAREVEVADGRHLAAILAMPPAAEPPGDFEWRVAVEQCAARRAAEPEVFRLLGDEDAFDEDTRPTAAFLAAPREVRFKARGARAAATCPLHWRGKP